MQSRRPKSNIQGTLFKKSETTNLYSKKSLANFFADYNYKIEAAKTVIQQLRKHDLDSGHCFMIFDEDLPEDQAYYEYPDGRVCIEQLDKKNIEIPRVLIKNLNRVEKAKFRVKHGALQ